MTMDSDILADTFGFDPDEATAHFIVHIPVGATRPVEISEHLSWQPDRIGAAIANWQGLSPEERWWLYTMPSATARTTYE